MHRLLTQRLLALVLSAGVFLLGAMPSWAVPMAGEAGHMPNMTMAMMADVSGHCSGMMGQNMMDKGMPDKGMSKKAPGGHCALCYAVCAASAANSGMLQDFSLFAGSYQPGSRLLGVETRPDAFARPPALPPPILRA